MLPLSFPLLQLFLLVRGINFVKEFQDLMPLIECAVFKNLGSQLLHLSNPSPLRSQRLKVLLHALQLMDSFLEIMTGSFIHWHRFSLLNLRFKQFGRI